MDPGELLLVFMDFSDLGAGLPVPKRPADPPVPFVPLCSAFHVICVGFKEVQVISVGSSETK